MVPDSPLAPVMGLFLLFICGLLGFTAFAITPATSESGPVAVVTAVIEGPAPDGGAANETSAPAAPDANTEVTAEEPAANADVRFVRATQTGPETWTFAVTVEHPDTGWDDYADGWDVVLPDGTVVKPDPESAFTRVLLHPHVNEQPFTRSQNGIVIPADVTKVIVRAHELVDGYGGREVVVDLTQASGPDFEVVRQD